MGACHAMGKHGWAHVMLWVGIGRCGWIWSGYGYKFDGKCWALVQSKEGRRGKEMVGGG